VYVHRNDIRAFRCVGVANSHRHTFESIIAQHSKSTPNLYVILTTLLTPTAMLSESLQMIIWEYCIAHCNHNVSGRFLLWRD